MKKFYLGFFPVLLLLSGCAMDESDYKYDDKFSVAADGWPISNIPIAESQLKQVLDGKGWMWVEGKTIKDGKVTKENYYETHVGGSGDNYFFHGDNVTKYFFSDSYHASCYWNQNISYDDTTNDLWIGGVEQLRIVSFDDGHFSAVYHVGTNSEGRKTYVLNTWERMSEEKLKDYQDRFTTDYSLL